MQETGTLSTSKLALFDNETEVGFLQIGYKASRSENLPESFASHIYYEIKKEFRNKGYGNKILELVKEKALKIGLKKLILIVYEDNLVSKKIIENNRGILEDEKFIEKEGKCFKI